MDTSIAAMKSAGEPPTGGIRHPGRERERASARFIQGEGDMATRERRLAEFNGNGEPPPDQSVEVLCEDHSGTYKLPFACRKVDGEWLNSESGSTVEATVVGWRLPRR